MSRLRDVLLVALDAADWSEYMASRDSLDAAIGEILRLEDELEQAREAYDVLRSLFVPEGAEPTLVGMQPVEGEDVVR